MICSIKTSVIPDPELMQSATFPAAEPMSSECTEPVGSVMSLRPLGIIDPNRSSSDRAARSLTVASRPVERDHCFGLLLTEKVARKPDGLR